jgi:aminopeptidase YwaD
LRGYPEGQLPTSTGGKAEIAQEKGAIGIIVVGPNGPGRAELPNYSRGQGMSPSIEIAGAGIRRTLFKRLTGMDYEETRAMTAPASVPLSLRARLKAELEPNKGMGRDVVGMLPGHDPKLKSEYIIVGAHYDHIGYGETGSMTGTDAIHPGADDNASGSAGVVALAQYFAKQKSNKRTIIFQLYQGEELGLLGSEAWAKNHPDALKKTSAMLNLDMIGRLRNGALEIYGSSTGKEWDSVINSVPRGDLQLQITPPSRPDSDHAAFAKREVPILFFFTGMHAEYHSEKDKFETLNTAGLSEVAGFVGGVLQAVDELPTKLTFQAPAVASRGGGDRANTQGRRIRVGFIPDMTDSGNGVLISGASPGSPAEKAGFKSGDRILEFNGHKLDGLEALAEAMVGPKPGDKIKVVFLRDGVEKTVEMVVEASNR